MTNKQILLEIDNLNVEFTVRKRRNHVIKDFNLEISKGEIFSIVGKSGCGKSTLLNAIAGYVPPNSGKITMNGNDIRGPGPDRAVVFQDDAVFPWLTVRGNIEYGLRAQNMEATDRRERSASLMELVGLTDFAEAYPNQLSGGMRKRCDIARTLAVAPPLLLMDEPFAALDVITKSALQLEIAALTTEFPVTIIFITHDLEEALFLGDRVLVMKDAGTSHNPLVNVDFERPRSLDLKTDPEFQAIRRQLIHMLGFGEN